MAGFVEKMRSRLVDSKYSLIRKLGEGGYGLVYLGRNVETGDEVALKLEHHALIPSALAEENETYSLFQEVPGFPNVHWYGERDDFKVMVFELLGPNLEDLLVFCDGRFSLKTTLMILDQLLLRFEILHSKGFLHRDVKPHNFLMGNGRNGNVIYMTDLGLACMFDPVQSHDENIEPRPSRVIGTPDFASIRGYVGKDDSPWEDLESLGYMAIYFLKGILPWQPIRESDPNKTSEMMMEEKLAQDISELCSGLPPQFEEYLSLARNTPSRDLPDYGKLRQLFKGVSEAQGIEIDDVYDWTVRMYFQQRAMEKAASSQ